MGGLHLLHSDYDFVFAVAKKKGDFDVVVAVFVMTVVVCSFEYLRLFLSVRPYEMSYRTVGDFLFCLSV